MGIIRNVKHLFLTPLPQVAVFGLLDPPPVYRYLSDSLFTVTGTA